MNACRKVVANRINDLKFLFDNSLTISNVVGECFARDGRLLASGRCGVKLVGQLGYLCVPDMPAR